MPALTAAEVGRRVAYHRRMHRLTQQQLADAAGVHVGTLRKIERGARGASDAVLDVLGAALGIDPYRLYHDHDRAADRVHSMMPGLAAAIAAYDLPEDGPVRPVDELRADVQDMARWRLGTEYVRIARRAPDLLHEVPRSLRTPAPGPDPGPEP